MTLGDRFEATMAAAGRGEEWAITVLYRDVNPQLVAFLRARARDDAEDLASEVWLTLARQMPSFRGDERRWLGFVFLVARRRLNDHWKQRARRRTSPVDADQLADRPALVDVEAAGLARVTTEEAADFVLRILPRDQADVILLRVMAGLDVGEVAVAIGKRANHVRVIQHRALRRLATALSRAGEDATASSGAARTPKPAKMTMETELA